MDSTSARVLVVDDHPVVRYALLQLIVKEPGMVLCGEAEGIQQALELFEHTQPDLIVTDITLKDGNGIELVEQVRARNSRVRILAWSMHDEQLYAERIIKAGGNGFISKQESMYQVVEAMRKVLAGKVYVSEAMADRLLQHAVGRRSDTGASAVQRLSDRELQVFELIGQGLGTRQIAERLHLSTKTVDHHRDNIKIKLNVENKNQVVRLAVEWVLSQE